MYFNSLWRIPLAGFWKVPSTASLHSGVHPGSQRAERWDGGRQEVCPQVRNLHAQEHVRAAPTHVSLPCLIRFGYVIEDRRWKVWIYVSGCWYFVVDLLLNCAAGGVRSQPCTVTEASADSGTVLSNLHLCVLQHARADRAVPSPTGPAKPGGSVSRRHLFLL